MSWQHCYNAFILNRSNVDDNTFDYLALHLAFYLASWGMYRGSSFLLQKDYKVHIPIVKIIMEKQYNPLVGITNVSNGDTEVQKLFGGKKYFDYPKSVDLLKILIGAVKDKDALILDFFSGSATTAHATMQLNREDGGNRQYIMVQIPDGIDEKSEAYKDGYHNLCEIGKERIRLAGAEIKEADIGFRVLKLDSSNMKDIYYNPAQIQQQSLFDSTDNIKEDRTPEDLLFQVMLDLGILLSSKIEEKTIAGKKVFNVADGFLIACFDNDVTEKTVKAVAQEKPYYAVFRDSSMANDSVATNFEQIFATYSPETVRKVL